MVGANEAEVAKEAVGGTNVIEVAALAVVANEDVDGTKVIDVAADAVVAKLLVPANVPVNEPVNDPVLICAELLTVFAGNSAVTCADEDTIFAGILLNPV